MVLEAPSQRLPRWGEFRAALDRHSISNGIAAFLVASTGPLVILLAVSVNGGLSRADISSWIFAGYGLCGVISIIFTVLYRMPMGMAWTIPGAVLLGTSLDHLPFAAVIGTYYVTATLILVLGLTGWVRRIIDGLPLPIVMGMVAGVFLPIVLKIISAFGESATIAGATLAAFLVLQLLPALSRIITPVSARSWSAPRSRSCPAISISKSRSPGRSPSRSSTSRCSRSRRVSSWSCPWR